MTERSPVDIADDAAATAAYVAAITAELSRLARNHGFSTLAYVLDMARQEARALADNVSSRGPGSTDAERR
ncbi:MULTISPECIES: hypothetical protein [Xanthobacter]|uniref:Uncharacterized protein n=1 Tax=Xanthobacter aminoxidans TaxID=186280 RepID=A0ABW6ZM55_9HYPH|nr:MULTISPECIES: hypothetical protein [unclassified Xanthobacter]